MPKPKKRNAPDLTPRNEGHVEKLIAFETDRINRLVERVVALEGKVEILQIAVDAALAMLREGQNAKTPHAKAVQDLIK